MFSTAIFPNPIIGGLDWMAQNAAMSAAKKGYPEPIWIGSWTGRKLAKKFMLFPTHTDPYSSTIFFLLAKEFKIQQFAIPNETLIKI